MKKFYFLIMGIRDGLIFCFYVFQIFYKEHIIQNLKDKMCVGGTEEINLIMPVNPLIETVLFI